MRFGNAIAIPIRGSLKSIKLIAKRYSIPRSLGFLASWPMKYVRAKSTPPTSDARKHKYLTVIINLTNSHRTTCDYGPRHASSHEVDYLEHDLLDLFIGVMTHRCLYLNPVLALLVVLQYSDDFRWANRPLKEVTLCM
jgi:hypothetical protein